MGLSLVLAVLPAVASSSSMEPAATDRVVAASQVVLMTNDLAYDPGTQMLYASVPSTAGVGRGNTITPIDPATATLGDSVFIGSEPNRLALSDNGQYVYVGLDGAAAVRRFDIASQTADLQFSISPYRAEELAVLPGEPASVAVSRYTRSLSPRHAGVVIFDDATPRPNTTRDHTGSNSIAFGTTASTLYGYNNESTSFGFYRLAVDANGLSQIDETRGLIGSFYARIQHADGRIYSTTGVVIDPETRTPAGQFAASGLVAVDPALRRVYFVSQGFNSNDQVTIKVFDQDTFVPVETVAVSGVTGQPTRLVQLGSQRLAVAVTTGTPPHPAMLGRTGSVVAVVDLTVTVPSTPAAAPAPSC